MNSALLSKDDLLVFIAVYPLGCFAIPGLLVLGLPILLAFVGPIALVFGRYYEVREPDICYG